MGSPLSPGIANIFMEHFEDLAIRTATNQPYLWLRYVDDTFVIWRHGQKGLEDFPNHFNSIRSSIHPVYNGGRTSKGTSILGCLS